MLQTKYLFTVVLSTISFFSPAQKKPLDHSSYDAWQSITSPVISNSGSYIYYTISPQEGDATTEFKTKTNQLITSIPRGYNLTLTHDEKFLISLIKPLFQEIRAAKIKKKKPEEMPKDSLSVFDIATKNTLKFNNIKNYKVAREARNNLAFIQEIEIPTAKDTLSTADKKSKKNGKESTLVLYNLPTGDTIQFRNAENYVISANEKYLVFNKKTAEKDSSDADGLYFYDIAARQLKKISTGRGTYKNITFDDASKQLIFLADKSPAKSLLKDFNLFYYTPNLDTAAIIATKTSALVPNNWHVSGDGDLSFSENGEKCYFGLAPIPQIKDTTLVEFEHAKVDIWHWQDDYLMPQQLANLKRDQSANYPAVFHIGQKRIVPLLDDTFNRISFTDSGNEEWGLATTDLGNRIAAQWQGYTLNNIFAVSTQTGSSIPVKTKWNGSSYLSPNGQHIVLFNRDEGNWLSYNITTTETIPLTKDIAISFTDEQNDVPALPGAYGIAGWSKDNQGVYIYDRYDIWYFSFDGKHHQLITKGFGRNNKITLRLIAFKSDNPRAKTVRIDPQTKLLLSSYNETSKQNGIFQLNLTKGDLQEIIQSPFTYRQFASDKKKDQIIYTKENYNLPPDLYLSKDFNNETKISAINPQQGQYNWGTAELVKWVTPTGTAAEGILYKPEDFDPDKKYPIIAYFYETLTEGLYTYQAPAPTPSRLNISFFVSNGYLVFAPDIRYKNGYPCRSAEEHVNSGMQFLAQEFPWVDANKMAIQGQSWGGYQVAHLITRTNKYAAAWAGAPVVNMTSAYGGIRWQSGMSRQFQYENTQSRIGRTLWDNKDLYIENSPLFFLDRVNTPVAIMHNDQDGAVPWYQGIEMFTALRRLGKPTWLLNYNGDGHNLMERQNRKDIQIRQLQFFDHFLKGKPAASWISKGVPAIKKGIEWGFNTEKD
ncbi:alpha/beta hydrolase family protein [Sphingobacterium pedocola]|uniref:Peptidase S9 n=1 Tax=Sphingobacterium pedocola TaxID=2082722 RepID=A0ABR9T5T2_9SPHI|nr:prolyl oligopeptidase family serine peptidase [Sphingobacterium pedocola]MBE8720704.1 peptidase S9 [Sphingobacterium pedocola]